MSLQGQTQLRAMLGNSPKLQLHHHPVCFYEGPQRMCTCNRADSCSSGTERDVRCCHESAVGSAPHCC